MPLYPDVLIPEIRTGVSIERAVRFESKSTVTVVDAVVPSPALIDEIPTC